MKLPEIIAECQRRIAAGDVGDYPNPFPRLADSRPLVQCARVKCGKMFRQNRPHQRYCDTSCQVGNWNDKQQEKAKAKRGVQEVDKTSETIKPVDFK